MDTDSNVPSWTEIWDGQCFVIDGRRPVNMLAVDGRGPVSTLAGKPFLPFAGGTWQPSGTVRAVDAFLPDTWYRVTVERFDARFTLEISDRFRYGGEATYAATIDAAQHCVWHFNRSASEDATSCVDGTPFDPLLPEFPQWPAGATWPDWFMFGDPHENFYMGDVLYDDVKFETWRE